MSSIEVRCISAKSKSAFATILALIFVFGFSMLIPNNTFMGTANAQTSLPGYPSNPSDYDIACSHLLDKQCSGGFGNWYPAGTNYVDTITWWEGGNCEVIVFYQMRQCLNDIFKREVRINLCMFDGANPDCFDLHAWNNLPDSEADSASKMLNWSMWHIFDRLIELLMREGTEYWIEHGREEILHWCEGTPGYDISPNKPHTFYLAGIGQCRGWCAVQEPDTAVIKSKYGIDLSKIPYPEYTESELASMNDYLQKEVNPYIEANGSKPFLPIDRPERARFIMKETSCDLDFCCLSSVSYCVSAVHADGSYDLNRTEANLSEWFGSDCDAKEGADYCDPKEGAMVYNIPCTDRCNYGDSVIQEDSTHYPTPHTEKGITRVDIGPNPTEGEAKITLYTNEDGHLNIILVDMGGNKLAEVYNGPIKIGEFSTTFQMLENAPSGIYFVQITFNDKVKMIPIIKDL